MHLNHKIVKYVSLIFELLRPSQAAPSQALQILSGVSSWMSETTSWYSWQLRRKFENSSEKTTSDGSPPPSHPDPELEFAYTCFSTCCWNIFSMFEIFIWNNICGQNKKLTLVISMDIWADWFIITWKCESGSAGKPICGSVPKMLCSRRNHAKYGVLPFGDVSAWCQRD